MSEEMKKLWEEHQVEIVLFGVVATIFVCGYMSGYKYGITKWPRHLSIKYFANAEGAIDRMVVNGKLYKLIAGAIPLA